MDRRQQLGRLGETLAEDFLERSGLSLLERRWRCRYGEIDLIMQEGGTLVLVEVRTRSSAQAGTPEESLTWRKRQRLALLSAAYLQALEREGRPWSGPLRVDLVAVLVSAGRLAGIRHIRSAVEDGSF